MWNKLLDWCVKLTRPFTIDDSDSMYALQQQQEFEKWVRTYDIGELHPSRQDYLFWSGLQSEYQRELRKGADDEERLPT